ncbi:flagellar biosynthetic protein FliO [Actinoplanes sp. NPDC049668]|uniref:flagellar biosynthetic protein FliO n=1 Tax=unclassified Actinoplanes TaxID=2626549 RepID=UPI0033AA465E
MFELVLRIGFSLLVVFGLLWALAKVVGRGGMRRRGSGSLSVLNRQHLTRSSSVAVVQVADRALILGVTDNQVSLLGETDLDAFGAEPQPERQKHEVLPVLPEPGGKLDGSVLSPRTWSSTLDFLRDRTTRR